MGERNNTSHPQYLFEDVNRSPFRALARYHRIALFLDFDGTLVPIIEDPAKCFLSEEMKNLLRSLANSDRVRLTIMSGRSLSDVRKRVGIGKIYYGGNHGFDVSGPGMRYTHAKAQRARPLIKKVKQLLLREIAGIEGAWIEDKKFNISLHFRSVKEEYVPLLKRRFHKVAGEFLREGLLGLIAGKKVLELTPDPTWNKGSAVLWILGGFKHKWLPVYIGDDKTDEDAFVALRNHFTVRLGRSGNTSAKYYIEGQREVLQFLKEIQKYISE